MPPELTRADYIVSANIGRTSQVCRQAVLDARRAVAWLAAQGYERIGILGTSLGSCLSMLTAAHEPLVRAAALNHISPYFADVVWDGLSTEHVREGLEGHIELDALRRMWLPISPLPYLDRMRDTRTLLVYARYDLTFPVDAVTPAGRRLRLARACPTSRSCCPCGHYSTGVSPFKWVDGYVLTKFLHDSLVKGYRRRARVGRAVRGRPGPTSNFQIPTTNYQGTSNSNSQGLRDPSRAARGLGVGRWECLGSWELDVGSFAGACPRSPAR